MPTYKDPQWQGIEMLPVVYDIRIQDLQLAQDQLKNLEAVKNKPYVLDDHAVEGVLGTYSQKISQSLMLHEQCQRWRNQSYLSEQQKERIQLLEQRLADIQKCSHKIMFLAEHFYKHTIDKVLEKDTDDLIRDMLTGNAYVPKELKDTLLESVQTQPKKRIVSAQQEALIKRMHHKAIAVKERGGSEAELLRELQDELQIIKTLVEVDEDVLSEYFDCYSGFYDSMALLTKICLGLEMGAFEDML